MTKTQRELVVRAAMSILGKRTSKKKAAASRANGKRPKRARKISQNKSCTS
jgi:hypothetical protein